MTTTNTAVTYSGIQGQVLEMLGNGLSPEVTAAALGITAGYVSQLVSEESFSKQVAERRFTNLQAATTRDRKYDNIEDTLATKLEDSLALMFKPTDIVRTLAVVNNLKRRGADAPANTTINQTVVNLILPDVLTHKFKVNENNQVVSAGNQELITIQSAHLSAKLSDKLNLSKVSPTIPLKTYNIAERILDVNPTT